MILTKLRKSVDSYTPWLGMFYRTSRDLTSWYLTRETVYGFKLAGSAPMSRPDFEPDEIQTFLRCCETHDVVLDIGANVGFYSCLAASRGKQVVAFEPSSRNLKFLYRNLWSNGLSAVEVVPVGLGRKPGLMPIYGFGGIASFVPGWAQAPKRGSRFVPVTTLDLIVQGRFENQKLLVKMDVEGYELEVLSGAVGILTRKLKPTWMLEILLADNAIPGGISSTFERTFNVFWDCGYQCKSLDKQEEKVSPETVKAWVRAGHVTNGAHNFFFYAS